MPPMLNHILLLPKNSPCPPHFRRTASVNIEHYQLHAVEKWLVERRPHTLLVVYTGNERHRIALDALVPSSPAVWQDSLALLRADGAKPKQTPHGVLMVTSLAHFRSDYTIVQIPTGDFHQARDQLYANINLLRMGCSGRTALTLEDPSDGTKDRFMSAYHLPESTVPLPTSVDQLPIPPPLKPNPQIGLGRPSNNHSTSSLSARKDNSTAKPKECPTFVATVLELVKLIQAGLAIFGLYPPAPLLDGLLCDHTVEGIRNWIACVGGPCVALEPTERIADPSFVAALLSLVLSTRNKLAYLGYTFVLPRDPFLYPHSFSLALNAYVQSTVPPPPSQHHHQTFSTFSPYGSIHVTTRGAIIPAAPPPTNILSVSAALNASLTSNSLTTSASTSTTATQPTGAILTRDLVDTISTAYDAKLKADSRKVRRVIKNRLAPGSSTPNHNHPTGGGVDSDPGEGDLREQRRHTLSLSLSLNGGESVPNTDRSPSQAGAAPGPGIGSSGGQILSGIGSLANGLRLGTGGGPSGADSDPTGALMVPTIDLPGFVAFVSAREKEKRGRKSRGRESVDFAASGIAIGYGYERERDGVIGGTVKALWSGRVADVVRMREDADGVSFSQSLGDKDRPTWNSKRNSKLRLQSGVASDGDESYRERDRRYDGRSTEEESDVVFHPGSLGNGSVPSFGGMWGGRVRGKLGSWAGLAKRKNQSVDLGTMHPPLKGKEKEKEPSTQPSSPTPAIPIPASIPMHGAASPPQPSRLVIGSNGFNGSMSSRPSVSRRSTMTGTGSGPQSPTLPPMMFNADGDRYADDDDLLSSGQVSPLSDYRPNPFNMLSNNILNGSNTGTGVPSPTASSTNLGSGFVGGISPQEYERTLNNLLNQKRPWTNRRLTTARVSSWADPMSARDEEGEEDEDEGDGPEAKGQRGRASVQGSEGEESDASRLAATGQDPLGVRWKRKEKARFHSLLSVMDGEGVLVEEPLEGSEDEEEFGYGYDDEEDMDEDGEYVGVGWRRRKAGFDARRRRSFHDLNTFRGIEVLSPERMKIDVDICGHLLTMWRREEHLRNVITCTRLIANSLCKTNVALRTHYETHLDTLSSIDNSTPVLASIEAERLRSLKILQSTNTLQYESAQFLVDDLWAAASLPRRKVFALREKVFGTGTGAGGGPGRRLPPGVHGAHGPFNRLQWTLDGQKRLVDHLGRTESEAEEENAIEEVVGGEFYDTVEGAERPATPKREEFEEGDVVENPGIKPMWLLRFFTSWGARWSASAAGAVPTVGTSAASATASPIPPPAVPSLAGGQQPEDRLSHPKNSDDPTPLPTDEQWTFSNGEVTMTRAGTA